MSNCDLWVELFCPVVQPFAPLGFDRYGEPADINDRNWHQPIEAQVFVSCTRHAWEFHWVLLFSATSGFAISASTCLPAHEDDRGRASPAGVVGVGVGVGAGVGGAGVEAGVAQLDLANLLVADCTSPAGESHRAASPMFSAPLLSWLLTPQTAFEFE
jgi:hypothetical protein